MLFKVSSASLKAGWCYSASEHCEWNVNGYVSNGFFLNQWKTKIRFSSDLFKRSSGLCLSVKWAVLDLVLCSFHFYLLIAL